jgi:predicted homoserine dehydrogenase-like protein
VLAGATLTRDVPVDHTLTYDDVELVESSLIVRMRRIQESMDDSDAHVPDLAALHAALVA